MKRRKEGFTLVELLIVMAVIAALMGALVPVAMSAIKHANATKVAENMRAILTAAQQQVYSEHSIPSLDTLIDNHSITGHFTNANYTIYYNDSNWASVTNATGTSWPSSAATSIILGVAYDCSNGVDATSLHNVWSSINACSDLGGNAIATTTVAKYW